MPKYQYEAMDATGREIKRKASQLFVVMFVSGVVVGWFIGILTMMAIIRMGM